MRARKRPCPALLVAWPVLGSTPCECQGDSESESDDDDEGYSGQYKQHLTERAPPSERALVSPVCPGLHPWILRLLLEQNMVGPLKYAYGSS